MSEQINMPMFADNGTRRRLKYVAPASKERAEGNATSEGYVGLEDVLSWTGRLLVSTFHEPTDVEESDELGRGMVAVFSKGDVLFGKLRPYLAKAFLADRNGLASTEFLVLRPTHELDGRFLLYMILTPAFISIVNSSTFGSKMPRAEWEFIGSIKVPIPPLHLQREIANRLDSETRRIDALLEEKEQMLALLVEKQSALVSRAVTLSLDPNARLKPSGLEWTSKVPAHWHVMQLKRTWSSSDYGISDSIREEGNVRVLRMSCITAQGRIDVENAGQVDEVPKSLLLHKNDLLFNRTNSLDQIAKVGLLDLEPEEPLSFASYLVRLRVNDRVLPEYLACLLNASDFLRYDRSNAIPAIGQANLSPTRYGDLKVTIPPRHEQVTILAELDQAIREMVTVHAPIAVRCVPQPSSQPRCRANERRDSFLGPWIG